MAARDKLDHDVLGSFNSRMAPAKAGRAAENIAYGYEDFKRTLDQWINSSGHRKNLLLPESLPRRHRQRQKRQLQNLLGHGDRRRL